MITDDEVAAALEGRAVAFRTHMYMYSTERCKCGEEYSEAHVMRFILEYVERATDPPQYEYGTRWPLSKEAHGPGKFRVERETSLEEAQETLRIVDGDPERVPPIGVTIVRRVKVGEWEEVKDDK